MSKIITIDEDTFPRDVSGGYNDIMTYFDYGRVAGVLHAIIAGRLGLGTHNVLEIGVGTGHFASKLKDMGYIVEGIDDSAGMVEKLRSVYPPISASVKVMNVEDLHMGKSFDIIVSAAGPLRFNHFEDERVFESYLQTEERTRNALQKCWEHLRPGGLFAMSINSDPEHLGLFKSTGDDMDVPHGGHYTKREWKENGMIHKRRTLYYHARGKVAFDVVHRFFWLKPEPAERMFLHTGFSLIGADPTYTWYLLTRD